MIRSETTSAKIFARVKSSDADVPRAIPASVLKVGVCGRVLPEDVVPGGQSGNKQRSGKGRRRGPLEVF